MISFILSSTLWSSWHRNGARWKEGSIQALDETPCHLLSVARQRCAHFITIIIIIIPLIPPADGNHENDRGSTKVIRWEENCGRYFLPFRNIQTSLSLSLDLKIRKIQQDGGEESEQRVQDRTHENALEKNTGEKEKERREELIDLSTMDPRCTWLQKLMIYVSGPGDGERSREEAGMCTRRSHRALWRSQSGLLPLLASSSPRPSVRPPARPIVATPCSSAGRGAGK